MFLRSVENIFCYYVFFEFAFICVWHIILKSDDMKNLFRSKIYELIMIESNEVRK